MSKIKSIEEFKTPFYDEFYLGDPKSEVNIECETEKQLEYYITKKYAEHVREVTLKEAAEKGEVFQDKEYLEWQLDKQGILDLINSENLKIE